MSLLLHACCGPCSLESTRVLAEEGHEFALYYDNPNIQPAEEYTKRLDALKEYVVVPGALSLFEGDYDADEWEQKVGIYGTDTKQRCRACYALRLSKTAEKAKSLGFTEIATTLTISPYQRADVILEELERAAQKHGIQALCRNFRPYYRETTRRSLELGMYRQNYCGCRFSVAEAEEQRKEFREKRRRKKELKRIAMMRAAAEGSVNQASQL